MGELEFRTAISPKVYLDDYLKFGIRNRIVAASALIEGWSEQPYDDQLLRGGKLLLEYGGAIEELFAFAYAMYMQCDRP